MKLRVIPAFFLVPANIPTEQAYDLAGEMMTAARRAGEPGNARVYMDESRSDGFVMVPEGHDDPHSTLDPEIRWPEGGGT